MADTKARVDELVQQLSDISPEVRLRAIEGLGAVDKDHALPALHWAIQNELDDDVRNAARDAYQRLSRAAFQEQQKAKATSGDKTRDMERPRVKAVTMEEGAANPYGRISFYTAAAIIILYLVAMIIETGQDPRHVPAVFRYMRLGLEALSIPGLGLGVLGLTRKRAKMIAAYIGTTINAIIFLVFFLKRILALF
jgi:hypothetical protein